MEKSSGSSRFSWKGVIETYRWFLPISETTPIITLREGNKPLIWAVNPQKRLDIDLDDYFKFGGMNTTGSFKDWGMTLALSGVMGEGTKAVICASTGNTAASAASLAGVVKKYREGGFEKGKSIACTLTGNGLKDPDTVFKVSGEAVKMKAEIVDVGNVIEKIL